MLDWGPVPTIIAYGALAGVAIPLGGLLARFEKIRPDWLESEFRHSVIAFGGGVLLAAVALVLVPEGQARLSTAPAIAALLAGGAAFMGLDILIARVRGSGGQLMAMLADFLPEAVALGATLTAEPGLGLVLALLIALQNLPEGFNAYREVTQNGLAASATMLLLVALVPLGPIAGLTGYFVFADHPPWLGAFMLFGAGGILYLTFQDIAPQTPLAQAWAPPLAAVGGFGAGILCHAVIGN
ncbi:MAG: divalent cation transporter [Alphaproteobacteria bacterium]|nr:divalent cation transporter [Alphaproteobacteria bacterium]